MIIPTTFQLGGRNWTVTIVDNLKDTKERPLLGRTTSHNCLIELDSQQDDECMQHTFYHEIVHALCYTLGMEKLNSDEPKVDALGGLLMQFLNTKKGNLFK